MTLSINQLSINAPDQCLLKDVSFNVAPGQILTVMGPSGCGKSTLLGVLAGHAQPPIQYQGDIILNHRVLNTLPPEQRRLGILFQDDLLFPHLNVWQNLAFALPSSMSKQEKHTQALEALTSVNLAEFANYAPSQLSGGQRARVSVLRALLAEPDAILLDEPFSKLDKPLRRSFRQFVFEQIEQRQIPAVIVTHDAEDIAHPDHCLNWPSTEKDKDPEEIPNA
ncbi:ATP-binding cassette domain-containing protein [Salinivibrio sp. ES.052]|uniref:ATP-binding cassette domain-containing protein n=1 Tax=Salinivibrio sp. ES.052 TaxID=1882823 RepID=UPI0009296758|nr:ATP-binding cassette domain-containing protein [Salinivibrio sp. ES.052]SIN88202.1 putative thiamine transport system ATP-binding protein [Salinivibrio sp. ES.052]